MNQEDIGQTLSKIVQSKLEETPPVKPETLRMALEYIEPDSVIVIMSTRKDGEAQIFLHGHAFLVAALVTQLLDQEPTVHSAFKLLRTLEQSKGGNHS